MVGLFHKEATGVEFHTQQFLFFTELKPCNPPKSNFWKDFFKKKIVISNFSINEGYLRTRCLTRSTHRTRLLIRSTARPFVVLVVLVCPIIVLFRSLVVLICQFIVVVCPLL